jgi:hypothetical protein
MACNKITKCSDVRKTLRVFTQNYKKTRENLGGHKPPLEVTGEQERKIIRRTEIREKIAEIVPVQY